MKVRTEIETIKRKKGKNINFSEKFLIIIIFYTIDINKIMKIGVVGCGFVGLTFCCLAKFGFEVNFVDKDEEKIRILKKGETPFFEPELENYLNSYLNEKLFFHSDYKKIKDCDMFFICVGTSLDENQNLDLSNVRDAVNSVSEILDQDFKIVVIKSTVPPGTSHELINLMEKNSGKKFKEDFGFCANPEFLKEGSSIKDFLNPDKIVLGVEDEATKMRMLKFYEFIDSDIPRIIVDFKTAEMIKYAQNAFLATKISFINEIANICEKFGVDVEDVSKAIGLDKRIGKEFLKAGIGFGGSCLIKDTKTLMDYSISKNYLPKLLNAVIEINENQPFKIVEYLKDEFKSLNGRKICVLGVTFKPNTSDIRDSRALPILRELIKENAFIKVYDPKGLENVKKIFGDKLVYCKDSYSCLKDCEACLILTDWEEFKSIDYSRVKILIDGRRLLDPKEIKDRKIKFKAIGLGK